MMKQYTISILLSLFTISIDAQACLPDSTLKDSSAGVFPRPITPENPNGGITKKACINKPYEFTLTVVVPDTVQIPILPAPLPLEKVAIDTANAISNLPVGISYSCNPPNCIFKKNELGCLILNGTPTDVNTPGDYKPIIKLKLTVNVGVPFDYTTEYPGPAFPGEYILQLQAENDCASAAKNFSQFKNSWYPNPLTGNILYSDSHAESVKVYNSQMQLLKNTSSLKSNLIELDQDLESGIYFIFWSEKERYYYQKIIVL
ncbi:MAG: T9SS type A sorting domain-containing protein [Saprospiraceae bacterium]|nr:T9SS type A sorting domain-containing protein [Saprospiraceae bacterium]